MRTLVCSTMLALTVAGYLTKPPGTATNPHPALPANYRQVVADFMKTQQFAQIGGPGIRTAEISDPHRTWSGQDVVCVRFGGGGWPNFTFSGGEAPSLHRPPLPSLRPRASPPSAACR